MLDSQRKLLVFQRKCRLAASSFKAVFTRSNKVTRRYLLALHTPNQQGFARLGILVAKRHVKRSVDRNLIRRIIRESFRANQATLPERDIIVMLRSPCVPKGTPIDKTALRLEVDALWPCLNA